MQRRVRPRTPEPVRGHDSGQLGGQVGMKADGRTCRHVHTYTCGIEISCQRFMSAARTPIPCTREDVSYKRKLYNVIIAAVAGPVLSHAVPVEGSTCRRRSSDRFRLGPCSPRAGRRDRCFHFWLKKAPGHRRQRRQRWPRAAGRPTAQLHHAMQVVSSPAPRPASARDTRCRRHENVPLQN